MAGYRALAAVGRRVVAGRTDLDRAGTADAGIEHPADRLEVRRVRSSSDAARAAVVIALGLPGGGT
ncbi:hypothetical protein [Geodermatophilus sp. SYSU D01176]